MWPLLITPLFPPQTGGIQAYLLGICQQMAPAPRVLTIAYPDELWENCDSEQSFVVLRATYAPRWTPLRLLRASWAASRERWRHRA